MITTTPERGWHVPYLGVPYLWGGRDVTAWDCWGLIACLLPRHYGTGAIELYSDVTTPEAGATREARFDAQEAAIVAGRKGWRRCAAMSGAGQNTASAKASVLASHTRVKLCPDST